MNHHDEKLINHTREKVKKEFKHHARPDLPFRNRYKHTQRVLKWAERIQELEGGDILVITLAVLLHDVGWKQGRPHQEVSYEFACKYLDGKLDKKRKDAVCRAVLLHNQRQLPTHKLSLEERIVMDADQLDEVGILSLIWDSLAVAREEKRYSYDTVYQRMLKYSETSGAPKKSFKTETGLKFYKKQRKVYKKALENLSYELGLDE